MMQRTLKPLIVRGIASLVIMALMTSAGFAWPPKVKIGGWEPAKTINEQVDKATKSGKAEVGNATETVKSTAGRATKSVKTEVGNATDYTKERGGAIAEAVKQDVGNVTVENIADAVQNPRQAVSDAFVRTRVGAQAEAGRTAEAFKQAGGRLADATKVELGNFAEHVKSQWWYKALSDELLSQFMEPPKFIVCGETYPGDPIWYVNGIATSKADATQNGNAIASRLKRRVHVIHNKTVFADSHDTGLRALGFGHDDLSECIYDRVWPVTVVARMDQLPVGIITKALGMDYLLQGNPTTRQLAHLLYHSKGKVSLLTHSQGCIIARNAFYTCFLFSKETKIRSNIAWVAAGQPLNDAEVFPAPRKRNKLTHSDDPVVKLLGVNGGGFKYNAAHHDFVKNYVPQLSSGMFWDALPASGPAVVVK